MGDTCLLLPRGYFDSCVSVLPCCHLQVLEKKVITMHKLAEFSDVLNDPWEIGFQICTRMLFQIALLMVSLPGVKRNVKLQSSWFQRLFDALFQLPAASWNLGWNRIG